MKMKKKLLSLLLALCFVMALVPMTAFAEGTSVDNWDGTAGQEHSAVFSACQVLFHTIYNEPIAGDRAHYALASAFCVCRKDGGLILKS